MKIDDFVINTNTIAISGHTKPDGDCVGSVLALYNYLELNYPDIRTDVFIEEPSRKFSFLKGFDRINSEFESDISEYDLMISLDSATSERLGRAERFFIGASHTVCFDHHVSNQGYADDNYIYPDSSSTCEVLFNHLDHSRLNKDIATCLYTGMVTDTGVFKYSCTSPATMRAAADLMEFEVPTYFVIDESFYTKEYNENRIMGLGIMKSIMMFDGQVVYSYITADEMKEYNVTLKELDGIVPQLRLTRGVRCAVFFYETGKNEWKVSFRSGEDYDVNRTASYFGGGGHIRAAGCTVKGQLETCIEAVLAEVERGL